MFILGGILEEQSSRRNDEDQEDVVKVLNLLSQMNIRFEDCSGKMKQVLLKVSRCSTSSLRECHPQLIGDQLLDDEVDHKVRNSATTQSKQEFNDCKPSPGNRCIKRTSDNKTNSQVKSKVSKKIKEAWIIN